MCDASWARITDNTPGTWFYAQTCYASYGDVHDPVGVVRTQNLSPAGSARRLMTQAQAAEPRALRQPDGHVVQSDHRRGDHGGTALGANRIHAVAGVVRSGGSTFASSRHSPVLVGGAEAEEAGSSIARWRGLHRTRLDECLGHLQKGS